MPVPDAYTTTSTASNTATHKITPTDVPQSQRRRRRPRARRSIARSNRSASTRDRRDSTGAARRARTPPRRGSTPARRSLSHGSTPPSSAPGRTDVSARGELWHIEQGPPARPAAVRAGARSACSARPNDRLTCTDALTACRSADRGRWLSCETGPADKGERGRWAVLPAHRQAQHRSASKDGRGAHAPRAHALLPADGPGGTPPLYESANAFASRSRPHSPDLHLQ